MFGRVDKKLEVGRATYRLALIHGPEMRPLVQLFRETFRRRDFTYDWLQKKYACEYSPVRGFSCVAFSEQGEAVAALGVLPWPIRLGDRTELAAQVVDGATHHQHRRRGLFARLGEMAVESCRVSGVSFLFGFAHHRANSYPGLIRHVGFTEIDELLEYQLPLRTLWMERVARRIEPLHRLYARRLERTLSAYAPADPVLGNSLIPEGFAATDRHQAFHAYKVFGGSRVLRTDSGRVWLKVRRGLLLGDLEASSDRDMNETLRVIERIGARLGVHQILFQSSRETRFSRFFANSRFRSVPCLRIIYRNLHSQIPADRLRFTFGDQDNF